MGIAVIDNATYSRRGVTYKFTVPFKFTDFLVTDARDKFARPTKSLSTIIVIYYNPLCNFARLVDNLAFV